MLTFEFIRKLLLLGLHPTLENGSDEYNLHFEWQIIRRSYWSNKIWIIFTGLLQLEQRQPTSNQEALGRTVTARASMPGSEMNCSTERYSTVCEKHRSSSKNGGNTTTQRDHTVHWAIAHRLMKPT